MVSRLPPATLNALFRLGFPTASHRKCLTWPQTVTRRLIMRKARSHPFPEGHRAPTACKCMVSGTFNSPSRGTFHRSLALLFTIGCRGVLSLGGWAPQLHTEFHELRATLVRRHSVPIFTYRTITFYGRTFQTVLLIVPLRCQRPQPQTEVWFGLIRFRSPLLTESRLISFPAGTEMFQFPAFASMAECIGHG